MNVWIQKKVFSPNNDGINDIWEIENINIYPTALVEIYSKNGYQVYRRRNYQNSINDAFNGIDMNGNLLPSATYYYVISIEETSDVYKGTITIVRWWEGYFLSYCFLVQLSF